MEEIDSGSPLPKIVNGTPTTTAQLAGVEVECLVDTASMVTLVSETLYNQKLGSVCSGVQEGAKMLTLQGANGLWIPYLEYLETKGATKLARLAIQRQKKRESHSQQTAKKKGNVIKESSSVHSLRKGYRSDLGSRRLLK